MTYGFLQVLAMYVVNKMVNTCVIAHCKTGYTKRRNKIDFVPERFPIFSFPTKKQT